MKPNGARSGRLGASSREREQFEKYGITAVSADLAMILAVSQGVPILHIGSGNLASSLDRLPSDQEVESEIEVWVLAGGEAEVRMAPHSNLAERLEVRPVLRGRIDNAGSRIRWRSWGWIT